MDTQQRIMRREEVAEVLGVNLRTLLRWGKEGYGPPVLRLGAKRIGYRASDVWNFIDDLAGVESQITGGAEDVNDECKAGSR